MNRIAFLHQNFLLTLLLKVGSTDQQHQHHLKHPTSASLTRPPDGLHAPLKFETHSHPGLSTRTHVGEGYLDDHSVQPNLADIAGSGPGHRHKASIAMIRVVIPLLWKVLPSLTKKNATPGRHNKAKCNETRDTCIVIRAVGLKKTSK